jgi:hypothetical protein
MAMKRYAALSLVSVAMLCLGVAALAAPVALQGPLLLEMPAAASDGSGLRLGLLLLGPQLYLTDVVGMVLLVLATAGIWLLAISWERRRPRR